VAFASTGAEGALIAAERLRGAVAAMEVVDEQGQPIPVTVSVGLAELGPADDFENLVQRADRAMYESKSAGRNRVSMAEPLSQRKVECRVA